MDADIRLGARVRAVRTRLGWRQADLAAKAKTSAATVLRIEHGDIARLQVGVVRAVLNALEIELQLVARWRGGDLDRVADEGHAVLVGLVANLLERLGWVVRAEVSFSVYGERGSIDLLAWHPPTATLLVVEVKTSLNSVEETLRRHDVKVRLASDIARERFGWQPRHTAWLLALPDDDAARRRVARHGAVLRRAYQHSGREAKRWLSAPSGAAGLILYLARPGIGGSGIAPRRRVRPERSAVSRASLRARERSAGGRA